MFQKASRPFAVIALAASLAACATVSDAVQEPQLTPITNPQMIVGAMPVLSLIHI